MTLHQDSVVHHERPVRDYSKPLSVTTFRSCGTYPNAFRNDSDNGMQGVTHDDGNWFFSNAKYEYSIANMDPDEVDISSHIWKVPVSGDIAAAPSLVYNPWAYRWDHFGAITYVNGRVFVALQPGNNSGETNGTIGVFDSDLHTLGIANVVPAEVGCVPDYSWIGYNPADGLFYGGNQTPGCLVAMQYIAQGTAGQFWPLRSIPFRKSLLGPSYPFGQQGGTFSNTGRAYLIDNSAIRIVDPLSGIVLSEMPFSADEGEGITVWDLSQVPNKSPSVRGHLHFQRYVSHKLGTDDYWLEHGCADDILSL